MAPASPGRIVTFYSYKGGTGRSMALANFAWILAASGKRVLVIDWDLEAPGLHRYFRPFLTDPELVETDGLIDAIWELAGAALEAAQPASSTSPEDGYGRVAEALEDATRRLRPIQRSPDDPTPTPSPLAAAAKTPRSGTTPLQLSQPPLFVSGGSIDLIGAGRQGPTYSARVNTFGWQRFYELDGARLLEDAKRYFRSRYDWVLIDSRTGVSDTAGICTIQMPDTVVACFTPNRQSVSGVSEVLHSIRSHNSTTIEGSKIRFFPVATRIENLEPRKLESSRAYFRGRLGEYLPESFRSSPREYWDSMEIPYKTGYAFEELLAAFGDATGALGAADTMLSHMEKMAQIIAEDSRLTVGEIVEAEREAVLARYTLEEAARSTPTAADPASPPPPPPPVADDSENDLLRNVRSKEQIWRTSNFRWRYLMSARELDLLTEQDRSEFGRNMSFYFNNSTRMRNFVRATDRAFLGCLLVPLTVSALYFIYYYLTMSALYERLPYDGPRDWRSNLLLEAAFIFPLVYLGCWMMMSLLYNRHADKPYGLRLYRVAGQIAAGPLRSEVPDYEALEVLQPDGRLSRARL
ncbi:MAG: hypothetical protein ACJ8EB_06555 [Allosphingosinicella sp.]